MKVRLIRMLIAIIILISILGLIYSYTSFEVFSLLLSLFVSTIIIIGYTHLAFKMGFEVFRPKDWLTPLRWMIFLSVMGIILTIIPGVVYRILQLYGYDSEATLNTIRIVTSINSLVTLTLIYSVFSYKKKE